MTAISNGAAIGGPTSRDATVGRRHVREVIRDEQIMRARILTVLKDGPQTIPEIAEALGSPTHEVVFWVMGLRKYGHVAEIKEVDDEGYFRYQTVPQDAS